MTGFKLRSLALAILLCLPFSLLAAEATSGDAASAPTNAEPFLSEKKVAIVVGISDYPPESGFPKLQFAAKDAQDLVAALSKQGYQTQLLIDQHAMKSSLRRALQQAHDVLSQGKNGSDASGTILFAFSGHGGQKGTGVGAKQYLVTFDSTADDPEPGFAVKEVVEALSASGAARKMMFIDACRDLTSSGSKAAPALSSFRDMAESKGLKILYSTAPGERSYEDSKSQNGYFTHYLLEGLSGKAAQPDGLVTFDSLANWVTHAMKVDETYQVPYWNQNASGDFYVAGHTVRKEALVIGIDRYPDHSLRSAVGGARQVYRQLDADGFETTFLENANFTEMKARLGDFAKRLGPKDVAVFYFAGAGGIASGQVFLRAADATLPDSTGAKWEKVPQNALRLTEVLDTVRQNHPGPNIFLLDMGLARANSTDTLDLASLKRDHILVLFSCKPGHEPERSEDGSLFSKVFVSVLKEPSMSAGYAAAKVTSAIYDQTNGAEYAIEIPMLPDRVYLTPAR